ncbi:MAG: DUF58 domain-containing protein [Sphingobacteriales bacterium]|nr:MAG: DUF58 domain-containing protein [Sphingobacteriales bacterium]TAF81545.1 MAG: DUF58 domain-containing protein [Sphingobacteriales bacterium]
MTEQKIDIDLLNSVVDIELLAHQVVEGFITGLHKSPFHGFSVEFAEHRLYNGGESVKNIDWKLFARTDKLFVKRFEEETNLRCQLVIDASSSMFYPDKETSKFKFSVMAAACLIQLLKRQRDAFGLTVFAQNIEVHTDTKSTHAHQKFLYTQFQTLLNQPQQNKHTQIAQNLHALAKQLHKRSMVVIFSDMIETQTSHQNQEALFAALQHLKYNKHEVIIFNVQQQKHEKNFDFENRPHHFIDTETGSQIKVNPTYLKQFYLQKFNAYKKSIALKCAQYKIDMVDATVETGFNNMLNAWLIKRNKMS